MAHTSGVAPVLKQSGNKRLVHRRYRCSKFLRQGFHEYAKESILHSKWAAAYYKQQRDKGSSHHTAVRSLAYKWIRIIYRCWMDKTIYDEDKYIQSLEKSGSPVFALLDDIEVGFSPCKKRVVS